MKSSTRRGQHSITSAAGATWPTDKAPQYTVSTVLGSLTYAVAHLLWPPFLVAAQMKLAASLNLNRGPRAIPQSRAWSFHLLAAGVLLGRPVLFDLLLHVAIFRITAQGPSMPTYFTSCTIDIARTSGLSCANENMWQTTFTMPLMSTPPIMRRSLEPTVASCHGGCAGAH